jgi:glutathione S-transferase
LVDYGPYQKVTGEVNADIYPMPNLAKEEAAYRMIKHHETLASKNPFGAEAFDDGVRCALTLLLTGKQVTPVTKNADQAIRYIRDRISVPRDMSIWAAKNLR